MRLARLPPPVGPAVKAAPSVARREWHPAACPSGHAGPKFAAGKQRPYVKPEVEDAQVEDALAAFNSLRWQLSATSVQGAPAYKGRAAIIMESLSDTRRTAKELPLRGMLTNAEGAVHEAAKSRNQSVSLVLP
jgi:hypothetical protein